MERRGKLGDQWGWSTLGKGGRAGSGRQEKFWVTGPGQGGMRCSGVFRQIFLSAARSQIMTQRLVMNYENSALA